MKVKVDECPTINIRYLGDTLKFMFPCEYTYTFDNLLEDSCKFFDLKIENYCFRDDLNNIYPLIPPVREIVLQSSKIMFNFKESEINLYLTNKTNLIEVGNNKFRRRDDDDNDPAIKKTLEVFLFFYF